MAHFWVHFETPFWPKMGQKPLYSDSFWDSTCSKRGQNMAQKGVQKGVILGSPEPPNDPFLSTFWTEKGRFIRTLG